jgi:LDH2 family malate/lactate/ureidoglycolate dehydrogenase
MAYLIVVIDPKLLMPEGEYPARVADLSDRIRGARPIDAAKPIRMPYDRSAASRRKAVRKGTIEIPDPVRDALARMAEKTTNR